MEIDSVGPVSRYSSQLVGLENGCAAYKPVPDICISTVHTKGLVLSGLWLFGVIVRKKLIQMTMPWMEVQTYDSYR